MNLKARTFQLLDDLITFFNFTVADPTKVVSIYYDAVSGTHVLIWKE